MDNIKKNMMKMDKEVLVEMILLLETMDDIQNQYEPLGDEYSSQEDKDTYGESSDKLREIKETNGYYNE